MSIVFKLFFRGHREGLVQYADYKPHGSAPTRMERPTTTRQLQ
jgi:hypothetical protein